MNFINNKPIEMGAAALVAMLGLAACNSATDPDPDTCTIPRVAAEPDVVGTVNLSAASVSAGGSFDVSIPVDGDTGFLQVSVIDLVTKKLQGVGALTIGSPAEQTVTVTVAMNSTIATGSHPVQILACTNSANCSTGVFYSISTATVSDNYWRGKMNGSGPFTSYQNACIPLRRIEVN